MMKYFLLMVLICSVFQPIKSQTNQFDHSLFDELLKEYVDDNGLVKYEAFLNNQKFEKYVASLKKTDLDKMNEKENYAFLINAYNALVIKNVIDHWPIDSPMDADGFFDKKKFKVGSKELTLNNIEYDLLFKINPVLCHFGLVCGATSCPRLLQMTYKEKNVYDQLNVNANEFLNDQAKNRLDKETNTLYLSEIFKWFKDIFIEEYGSLKNAAAEFMNEEDADYLGKNDVTIKYIRYNWKLNSQ
ncbi:MAG: DUF547 domain-containing protein [Ignavibacteria bacterium]